MKSEWSFALLKGMFFAFVIAGALFILSNRYNCGNELEEVRGMTWSGVVIAMYHSKNHYEPWIQVRSPSGKSYLKAGSTILEPLYKELEIGDSIVKLENDLDVSIYRDRVHYYDHRLTCPY